MGPERRRFVRLAALSALAALPLAGTGCERGGAADADAGMTRTEFIETYVELRRAEAEASSDAEFEERREEILARRGATAERLLAFVEAHGEDVDYLAAVFDTIRILLEEQPEEEG